MFKIFLFFISFLKITSSSNWAQVSGFIKQNTVIPYYPSPGTPHWTARYGMATIVVPAGNLSSISYVYLFGGDSFDDSKTKRNFVPGLTDLKWENGYKNDVWRMEGINWYVRGDIRLKSKFGRKIPKVESRLKWVQVTAGLHPPSGKTNDEWIACEDYFKNLGRPGAVNCTLASKAKQPVQWSPRRHHAGVYFKGYIWIMGGRAREFVDLPEERSIGGIQGPRVKDIDANAPGNQFQSFTTQREAIITKSDVWRSLTGRDGTWELVTPGCQAPQSSLIAEGNKKDGKFGISSKSCTKDADCYGAESCDLTRLTCVCLMWSSREQHAVAAYGNFMYVSGGFASVLYSQFSGCGGHACGDTDASAYRYYLADVWRSSDGQSWTLITEKAFSVPGDPRFNVPLGRGGHQMLAITSPTGEPELWVLGGRGGDNSFNGRGIVEFNDIWTASITGDPDVWLPRVAVNNGSGVLSDEYAMPWAPRLGHAVALEEASPANLYTRTLYLSGGYSNGSFYDDLWAWRIDVPGEYWRKDFTSDAYFGTGTGTSFHYSNNSPSVYYVTPDSDVEFLRRFWIPTKADSVVGQRYQLRPYLSSQNLADLRSVGVKTIRDLAVADVYTILKLRGFDYPQIPLDKRLHFDDVCDFRALAIALVDKCSLNLPSLYDGEKNMPWNNIPVFGGPPPPADYVKWHGRNNYNFLLKEADDPDTLINIWDGCEYVPEIQGLFGPDINGIGYVKQVSSIRNPHFEIQNLFCRQDPGPRAYHSIVLFQGLLYILGGKKDESEFYADTWYRDSNLPVTTMTKRPKSHSTEPHFFFSSNKPGAFYEYRIWDPLNYKEIRGWTAVTKKAGVSWLNWRKGGPGSGLYELYVRTVDPAGNRDERFVYGQNVYRWYYISPTPYDIIMGAVGGFIGFCIIAYMEYRRRVKKAAMERYAMKRMRRKFKAMQRDIDGKAVDWRTLYMESKAAEEAGLKNNTRKIKKTRDKNAEKREKEKKRREKEKDMIKKKLKANKDFKEKKKPKDDDTGEEEKLELVASKKGIKKSQVAAVSDLLEDEEFETQLPADGGKPKPVSRGKSGISEGKVLPSKGDKEIAAGDLPATKNTELGFKQRKANARFKAYEQNSEDIDEDGKKDV